ncbi:MAG: hypothetical protein U1D55_09885 [Phycisphaerae bacterium]
MPKPKSPSPAHDEPNHGRPSTKMRATNQPSLAEDRLCQAQREAARRPPGYWIGTAAATSLVAGPLLAWGTYVLLVGRAWLPTRGWYDRGAFGGGLVLTGRCAKLFGIALLAACVAMIANAVIRCLDGYELLGERLTYVAGAVALLLVIAALVLNIAGFVR